MPDTTLIENSDKFRKAFREHERHLRIRTGRVACLLVFLLMPFGSILDYFVEPDKALVAEFFKLRLLCSLLISGVWLLHSSAFARERYPPVGLLIVLLPAFFITLMIREQGAGSSYYAGLNLILLAVSAVGHWSIIESFVSVGSVVALYVFFGLISSKPFTFGPFFNNLYFLGLTGIIVVSGNYVFNLLRFREFALRHELDSEKKKTEQRNRELADAYQKLTEQESQIVQSQKMASVGQMSAGIIHEINNPLNFATTGLFTLRKKSKHLPAEQRAEYDDIVKDIEDGIGRVKNIVSDLRTFTHPNTDILDQVVVSDVVASALRFLSNEVKDKAIIEQKLPPGQAVLANKNKLIHLFVNLIQNSLDALRTKPFPNGEQPTIWIEGRAENGSNYLVVRDNGPGIPIDQVDKIYDPFFTTKAVGEGMGLGLSMCARIMKDSQGKISVRTEKGKFCEFTLEFPVPT